jgi:hypothetical protein|eukprot:SAG25_NODE_922_length_4750_cov_27.067512_8_plen_65_part_00
MGACGLGGQQQGRWNKGVAVVYAPVTAVGNTRLTTREGGSCAPRRGAAATVTRPWGAVPPEESW